MDEAGDKENLPGAAAPGSQRRVFISYASHDVAVAGRRPRGLRHLKTMIGKEWGNVTTKKLSRLPSRS